MRHIRVVSRQREHQRANNARGLCRYCSVPMAHAGLCKKHHLMDLKRKKAEYHAGGRPIRRYTCSIYHMVGHNKNTHASVMEDA